jgi:hypothetical protein
MLIGETDVDTSHLYVITYHPKVLPVQFKNYENQHVTGTKATNNFVKHFSLNRVFWAIIVRKQQKSGVHIARNMRQDRMNVSCPVAVYSYLVP